MTIWGLEHYPRTSVTKDTIRFSRLELGKRRLLGRKSASLLTGFIIRRSEKVEVVDVESARIRNRRWNGITGRQELMELRVCNLNNLDAYLALDCVRIARPRDDTRPPSGYWLSSQRDLKHIRHSRVLSPFGGKFYNTLDREVRKPRIILASGT
jgi:hypothetical protein